MSELVDKVIEMATTTDMSGYQIGKALGCSQGYVSEILKKNDIARGYFIDWNTWRDYIVENLNNNVSQKEIARVIGCSKGSLSRYITINNLEKPKSKAVESKHEVTLIKTEYGFMFDVSDYFIDRPCIVKAPPKWKVELQRKWDETNGREGVYYGIGHAHY